VTLKRCPVFLAKKNAFTISGWWFGTFMTFHILGIMNPTDFHGFQRGRAQPPTRSGKLTDHGNNRF
jgi:hypothetical protein